jgi:integrase/recombinase XerD
MELIINTLKIENTDRISIVNLQFDTDFPRRMKTIKGSRWCPLLRCWHLPYNFEIWEQIRQVFAGVKINETSVFPVFDIKNVKPESSDFSKIFKKITPDNAIEALKNAKQEILMPILQKEDFVSAPNIKNPERKVVENLDKLVLRYAETQPDSIFFQIPHQQATWQRYIGYVTEKWWHDAEQIWSVPRTPKLWKEFSAFFGDKMVIDRDNPVFIANAQSIIYESPFKKLPLNENKIGICENSMYADFWCINLPKALVPTHLKTLKNIRGRQWNKNWNVWDVPATLITQRFLEKHLGDVIVWHFDVPKDTPEKMEEDPTINYQFAPRKLPQFENAVTALEETLMLLRYSVKTRKGYTNCFRNFALHYDGIKPSQLTRQQINAYILHKIKTDSISESYQSQILSAIKMFYAEVVKQPEKVEGLLQPKKAQKLPKYLTESEIVRLFEACDNQKHKCILMVIYSAGLRLGELTNLCIHDLQPEEGRIFVRNGKGKKDRCTILSPNVWEKIKAYMDVYQPVYWLFEGQTGGKYGDRSVQKIMTEAKIKSGINNEVTVHSLRHSFATHLVDAGTSLNYVQDLLGHESIKTTEIYSHLTTAGWNKIKSPIDNLKF